MKKREKLIAFLLIGLPWILSFGVLVNYYVLHMDLEQLIPKQDMVCEMTDSRQEVQVYACKMSGREFLVAIPEVPTYLNRYVLINAALLTQNTGI